MNSELTAKIRGEYIRVVYRNCMIITKNMNDIKPRENFCGRKHTKFIRSLKNCRRTLEYGRRTNDSQRAQSSVVSNYKFPNFSLSYFLLILSYSPSRSAFSITPLLFRLVSFFFIDSYISSIAHSIFFFLSLSLCPQLKGVPVTICNRVREGKSKKQSRIRGKFSFMAIVNDAQ